MFPEFKIGLKKLTMSEEKKPEKFEETVEPTKGAVKVTTVAYADYADSIKDIATFECSQRTKALDYTAIAKTAVIIFTAPVAIAWATKFNLHGQKLKPGDFVKVNGKTHPIEHFNSGLASQKGWAAYQKSRGEGTQKISNKDLVTVSRLSRALAKATIKMIMGKKDKPEDDISAIADEVKLPLQYAFISSPYGMTNDEIVANDGPLTLFFQKFDSLIQEAHAKSWVSGSNKRSHAAEYANLKLFRGISVPKE